MKDDESFTSYYFTIVFWIIVTLVIFGLAGFVGNWFGMFGDRMILEQSKSYIEGRQEKASVLILEYENASPNQQKFIRDQLCDLSDELGDRNSTKELTRFANQNCY